MNTFSVINRIAPRVLRRVGIAMAIVLCAIALETTASAQDYIPYKESPTPNYGPVYNGVTNCYDSPDGNASFCPNANGVGAGGGGSRTIPRVDPCFIAQNAMRPCTPEPVGVDPK